MLYTGDLGVQIVLDTDHALTSATRGEILYRKPSGETGVWLADIVLPTQLSYQTILGDIDESGKWTLQARVTFPGELIHGEPVSVRVDHTIL